MKGWRFWAGVAFGMFASYALDQVEWASWVKVGVFLVLFFIAQAVTHRIAES